MPIHAGRDDWAGELGEGAHRRARDWAVVVSFTLEVISDTEGKVMHAVGGTKSDRCGRVVVV